MMERSTGATEGRAMIPPEIVSCIALGRTPSVRDLCNVAARIRADVSGPQATLRPIWIAGEGARAATFRAAHAALAGCPE